MTKTGTFEEYVAALLPDYRWRGAPKEAHIALVFAEAEWPADGSSVATMLMAARSVAPVVRRELKLVWAERETELLEAIHVSVKRLSVGSSNQVLLVTVVRA